MKKHCEVFFKIQNNLAPKVGQESILTIVHSNRDHRIHKKNKDELI